RVVHSAPPLDQAALDAVRQWEYTPALLNSVAVAVIVTVGVNLSLQSSARYRAEAAWITAERRACVSGSWSSPARRRRHGRAVRWRLPLSPHPHPVSSATLRARRT